MGTHRTSKFKIGSVISLDANWNMRKSSIEYVIIDITRKNYILMSLNTKRIRQNSRSFVNTSFMCIKDKHFNPAVLKTIYSRAGTPIASNKGNKRS